MTTMSLSRCLGTRTNTSAIRSPGGLAQAYCRGHTTEKLALPWPTPRSHADTQARPPAGEGLLGAQRRPGLAVELAGADERGGDQLASQRTGVGCRHPIADGPWAS